MFWCGVSAECQPVLGSQPDTKAIFELRARVALGVGFAPQATGQQKEGIDIASVAQLKLFANFWPDD